MEMLEFFENYKFLIVPFITWFGIQLFKVFYKRFDEGVWDFSRLFGAGGMPSAHSATTMCITTMIGKSMGINSAVFAMSLIFSLVVMYDAAGVRRNVGEQAQVLNDILKNQNLTSVQKLQEMTGHTPVQVVAGAIIGIIAGIIF